MFERRETSQFLKSPYSDYDASSWSLSKIAAYENPSGSNLKRRLSSSIGKRLSFGVSRKSRTHSKSTLFIKFFWLVLIVMIPLYLPYLLVQLQLPSLLGYTDSAKGGQSAFVNQHTNFKGNYQDRRNFMNVASIKAGAKIYELNCFGSEAPQLPLIAPSHQHPFANVTRCRDLKPLIDEKISEPWSFLGNRGSLYLEFRDTSRIYALGLEFYDWEAKWLISNPGSFVLKGINPTGDSNSKTLYEETELIDIDIGSYDESEEHEQKIRLYYDCKTPQCYEKYQGIVFELRNPNPSNLKNNIEKIFIFERF